MPNNPLAFPRIPLTDDYLHGEASFTRPEDGMTLRDYFAGQALIATSKDYAFAVTAAEEAYRIADAMLTQREIKP